MSVMRFQGLAAAAALVTGCATSSGTLPTPSPAEIPSLEADFASYADVGTGLQLAAAYREAGRTRDALGLVEPLLQEYPDDAALGVMAGLLAEDAGDFDAARSRYQEYLAAEPTGSLRGQVEQRLAVMRLAELRADVRSALEREAEVAQTVPDPAAVGVFPFAYEGSDPSWEPLGPALAELLVTDLGITGRLRVLERVHVQTLLDEMAIAEAGYVEEATAARSGRLLGSGHIVQGRFRIDAAQQIGVDAALVEVGPPGAANVESITRQDAVERLFDLEKELALDLHAELGIELTPAELALVNERQTESVQALLAFGRGLLAQDRGDFQQAAEQFGQAASLDPSFSLAVARREVATRAATGVAGGGNRQQLAGNATRLSRQRAAVRALRAAPASVRQRVLQRMSSQRRAVLAEVLGQDRVGTAILLELVFRSPGGGE